jgi:hypothetical protein
MGVAWFKILAGGRSAKFQLVSVTPPRQAQQRGNICSSASVSLCNDVQYSSALPFAGATRPCVGRARTSRRGPLAGPRCAGLPGPRSMWFQPVLLPVCGFWVLGSGFWLDFALRCVIHCNPSFDRLLTMESQ